MIRKKNIFMREGKTIYRWKFAVRMLFFFGSVRSRKQDQYSAAGTFVHPKIDNGRFLRCRVGNKYVAGSASFRASGGHPIPFTE